MTETASAILKRAQQLYWQGTCVYRDLQLEVGRTLHDYVLAYLREHAGKSSTLRIQEGGTRSNAIATAAEALELDTDRVNTLISVAMTVELLAQDRQVGKLVFECIHRFTRLIQRRVSLGSTNYGDASSPGIEEVETWEIKPKVVKSAPLLFRRAVEENWSISQAEAASKGLFNLRVGIGDRGRGRKKTLGEETEPVFPMQPAQRGVKRQRRVQPSTFCAQRPYEEEVEEVSNPLDKVCEQAAQASSGDVVGICLKIVSAARDPWQVAQRLLVDLKRVQRQREVAELEVG